MPVHNDRVESEGSKTTRIRFHIVAQLNELVYALKTSSYLSGLALAQTINIYNGNQVVEFIIAGKG